jgi:hypothetical protein
VIQPGRCPSESDFDEIAEEEEEEEDDDILDRNQRGNISASNLSKMAEAANKKMRKLKSNFSLKKNDITRSLSRIKKADRLPYSDGYVLPGKFFLYYG